MHTALLSGPAFTHGDDASDVPESRPDHHIHGLLHVVDIVTGNRRSAA
jgi:hypothetical protein